MSLDNEIRKLRKTIFNMLNYANMFVLVLNEEMTIKYSNNSLAKTLGFDTYKDIIGKCWIDFLIEDERKVISVIHKLIADGGDWDKYKEFRNHIQPMDGEPIMVHWFNSHINTDFNWSFSFGITKTPNPTMVSMESIRDYYKDIIEYDRTMIEAMRNTILEKENETTCQPTFM